MSWLDDSVRQIKNEVGLAKITENSTIKQLTDGECTSISVGYDDDGHIRANYSGPLVWNTLQLIDKTGITINSSQMTDVGGEFFQKMIIKYQKENGLPQTGILTDELLQHIYKNAKEKMNDEVTDDTITDDEEIAEDDGIIDPHYDPFFLNNSSKDARRNHKDIIIAFGDGTHYKRIKNVFMRSVSVQVDTSGNPITEVYNFLARDIVETDAEEDMSKYTDDIESNTIASDIKYNFDELFKDK